MKAMIFAAGIGSRLKPFTLEHPKALAPVGGRPILGLVIEKLIKCGVDFLVINVHHFAEQIVNYLSDNHNFGIDIKVSDESGRLLDTGGGLRKASEWLRNSDDPIIVHNADILTDFPLHEMVTRHIDAGNVATLLAAQRPTSRYLLFDQSMRMRGWTNMSSGEVRPVALEVDKFIKFAFGGVHVVAPRIFDALDNFAEMDSPFSITDFYIDKCAELPIGAFLPPQTYNWFDIGRPDSLKKASDAVLCGI